MTSLFDSNKVKKSDLIMGDHIYSYRKLHAYSHHGIYVGDDKVIHFNPTKDDDSGSSSSSSSQSSRPVCEICGYDKRKHKGVVKTCLECFSRGHGLYLFKYGVSSSHFVFSGVGTCSTNHCDDPITVVQRAESMFGRDNGGFGFGEYSFTKNNCECFAFHCKTGKRLAHQVVYGQAFLDVAFHELRPRNIVNPFRFVKSVAKIKMECLQRDQMARHQPDRT